MEIMEIMKQQPNLTVAHLKKQCYGFMDLAAVKNEFGSKENFLARYTPSLQAFLAENSDNVWLGNHPTLVSIKNVYPGLIQVWIKRQLEDLNIYLGSRGGLTESLLFELPQHIYVEFYYLKVSEVMYFFWLVKDLRFGEIYGHLNPADIMMWLRQFVQEIRKPALEYYEQQIEDAYEQWHSQNVVKDRDLSQELPNIMRVISEKIGGNKASDTEGSDLVYESALTLVNNTANLSPEDLMAVCKVWTARHGCDPYEYVTKNKKEG